VRGRGDRRDRALTLTPPKRGPTRAPPVEVLGRYRTSCVRRAVHSFQRTAGGAEWRYRRFFDAARVSPRTVVDRGPRRTPKGHACAGSRREPAPARRKFGREGHPPKIVRHDPPATAVPPQPSRHSRRATAVHTPPTQPLAPTGPGGPGEQSNRPRRRKKPPGPRPRARPPPGRRTTPRPPRAARGAGPPRSRSRAALRRGRPPLSRRGGTGPPGRAGTRAVPRGPPAGRCPFRREP
jgi:hypothetical protein